MKFSTKDTAGRQTFFAPLAVLIFTLLLAFPLLRSWQQEQQARYATATPTTAIVPSSDPPAWKPERAGPQSLKEFNMADYTANGSGNAVFDGGYDVSGVSGNGYNKYTNGLMWLWSNGTTWYASDTPDSSPGPEGYYQFGSVSTTPPLGLWDSGNAIDPPFTLSVGGGGDPPDAPGVPTFSLITQTTLRVTMPVMPDGATTMTLQRSAHDADSWSDIETGIEGDYAVVDETGLTPGTTYDYRAVAFGAGGETEGSLASVTTASAAQCVPRFKIHNNGDPLGRSRRRRQ